MYSRSGMMFAGFLQSTNRVDNSVDNYGDIITTMCHPIKHNNLPTN